MVLDMVIAVTVPLVIQSLAVEWSLVKPRLRSFVSNFFQRNVFYRTIDFEKVEVNAELVLIG